MSVKWRSSGRFSQAGTKIYSYGFLWHVPGASRHLSFEAAAGWHFPLKRTMSNNTMNVFWRILMACTVVQLVRQLLGPTAAVFVIAAGALVIGTAAVMHYRSGWAVAAAKVALLRSWIQFVHQLTSAPLPAASAVSAATETHWAKLLQRWSQHALDMKQQILGQDRAIDAVMLALRNRLVVRLTAEAADVRPLGIFVLRGAPGSGRRTLACACGRLLDAAEVREFDCGEPTNDQQLATALFGDGGLFCQAGSNRTRIVVIRHFEQAGPRTVSQFARYFRPDGCLSAPWLRNAALFLTIDDLDGHWSADEGGCSAAELAASVTVECNFASLGTTTIAQVAARLLEEECRRFGLALDYVEPQLLMTLVSTFSRDQGFRLLAARVAQMLREPIARALSYDCKRLSLTQELFVPYLENFNHDQSIGFPDRSCRT